MTPHQVIALLTQNQTHDLMCACAQYLPPERILSALREGLEPDELRILAGMMKDYFVDSDDET